MDKKELESLESDKEKPLDAFVVMGKLQKELQEINDILDEIRKKMPSEQVRAPRKGCN